MRLVSAQLALLREDLLRRNECLPPKTKEQGLANELVTAAIKADSSWSHNDPVEDGGPTIRLPAAESGCTLFEDVQYTRSNIKAASPGDE